MLLTKFQSQNRMTKARWEVNISKSINLPQSLPESETMGALLKLFDSILLVSFLVHALAPPLIGAQLLLPRALFPDLLIDFRNHYITQSGDYLMAEAPHFFIGLLWLELLLQWPLTLLNLYAISTAKSWLHTTCLIYGVSLFSAMVFYFSAQIISLLFKPSLLLFFFIDFLILLWRWK